MQKDINRISKNILALLLNAKFPGSHAPAVSEAITFIERIIHDSEEKEAPHSDINAEKLPGVGDGKVRNPRRKNNKNSNK